MPLCSRDLENSSSHSILCGQSVFVNMPMRLACLLVFFLICNQVVFAQHKDSTLYDSKSACDIQLFGNQGFGSFNYNYRVIDWRKAVLAARLGVGFVPGSGEDSSSGFIHVTTGCSYVYCKHYNQLVAGLLYSSIFRTGYDKDDPNRKRRFNRIIGELGFIRYFKGDDKVGVKLCWTPVLYDDGANDVQFMPVSIAFRAMF